jgi:hypothetical protein
MSRLFWPAQNWSQDRRCQQLPLATRDLEIRLGNIEERPGLRGASEMVMSQLFAPDILNQWANNKKPNLPLLY